MSATPSPVVRKRWRDAMTKELEEEAAYYEKLSSTEKEKYLEELQKATDKFEASRAKKKSKNGSKGGSNNHGKRIKGTRKNKSRKNKWFF
jgi:poly(A) polymerase Pap1